MLNNSSFSCLDDWNSTNLSCLYEVPHGASQGGIVSHENEIVGFIYYNVAPVFLIIGLISNCVTCYIVNQPPLNAFSVCFYSLAYTISNILTLFFNFGIEWLYNRFEQKHFKGSSGGLCRIWEFLIRLVTYSGIWFIVAMGIDRYIALWHPARAEFMCSVFMAKVAVTIIMTFLTVISIHAMWIYETYEGWCTYPNDVYEFLWRWVSGMSYGTIPLAIMFTLANLMTIRLCLKHRGRQLPGIVETEMDLTMVVVVLCFVYFLCNTPATVVNIYDAVTLERSPELNTLRIVTNLLWWTNHTCLFFVAWFSCSKAFRKTLKALFVKCKMRFRNRRGNVELKMLAEENEEIQTDNTSV